MAYEETIVVTSYGDAFKKSGAPSRSGSLLRFGWPGAAAWIGSVTVNVETPFKLTFHGDGFHQAAR